VPDLTHILRRDPAAPAIGHYRTLLKEPVDPAVREQVSNFVVGLAGEVGTVRP